MLVSCLLPTFNRYPRLSYLLEEAVECFLQQTYTEKELIICNDTPGQHLNFSHPQVRTINCSDRFPTLGEKLHWMLEQAQGDYICRWDDDDISLPWRLSHSVCRLYSYTSPVLRTAPFVPPKSKPPLAEWRPENHWYDPQGGEMSITTHPGNTHIMSIWHRRLIFGVGVKYPGRECPSGCEDQTFNRHIWSLGYPRYGTVLLPEDIFYLYRWGTGSKHLSGRGGGNVMQESYELLATDNIWQGQTEITPRFHSNHLGRVGAAIARLKATAPLAI